MASQLVFLSAAVLLGLLLPSSMAGNVLYGGDKLKIGESLNQGAYTFIMQSDCNLVLYDNGKAVWSTETNGLGHNCFLQLKTDGTLIIFNDNNKPVWATAGPESEGKFVLVLQRDRNVVLYGCPTWATGTNTDNYKGVVTVKRAFTPVVVVAAADGPTNRKIAMVTNN